MRPAVIPQGCYSRTTLRDFWRQPGGLLCSHERSSSSSLHPDSAGAQTAKVPNFFSRTPFSLGVSKNGPRRARSRLDRARRRTRGDARMLFGRATKDDAYYRTMPRVPRYEFEEIRTRWALESTTAATADDRGTRRAMRAATGLASASHEPYRPLGAVDVDRAMCEAPRREDPPPRRPSRTRRATAPVAPSDARRDRPVRPDRDRPVDDQTPPRRVIDVGRAILRDQLRASRRRVHACRAGISFARLLPPSLDARANVHLVDSPPPPATRSPRVSASLRLRPSEAIAARANAFESTRRAADANLAARLARLDREREETFRRKRAALDEEDATRAKGVFLADDWRLRAERRRVEARLRALETHAWYGRMLKMEGCAMGETRGVPADVPGGFGGGAGGASFAGSTTATPTPRRLRRRRRRERRRSAGTRSTRARFERCAPGERRRIAERRSASSDF